MTEERKPPPRFRRPSELLDDEVVEIPPETERSFPRVRPEPFSRLVQTPAEQSREVLATQRKLALQLDGFGQAMNRRFDIFHEELALQRADLVAIRGIVTVDHEKRLGKVELTVGQKAARGGGIVGILIVALPLLSEVLPKWGALFDAVLRNLQ